MRNINKLVVTLVFVLGFFYANPALATLCENLSCRLPFRGYALGFLIINLVPVLLSLILYKFYSKFIFGIIIRSKEALKRIKKRHYIFTLLTLSIGQSLPLLYIFAYLFNPKFAYYSLSPILGWISLYNLSSFDFADNEHMLFIRSDAFIISLLFVMASIIVATLYLVGLSKLALKDKIRKHSFLGKILPIIIIIIYIVYTVNFVLMFDDVFKNLYYRY